MQWIANIAVAVHWFNPLVWVATRALRAERERACDDAVLALGAAPDDYAAHLLDMVRALGARGGPAPAMAMARRSQFEGRLLAILDRACSRAPVGAGRLIAAGAGAVALVLILGGVRSTEAARLPETVLDTAQLRLPIGVVAALREPDRAIGSRSRSVRSVSPPSNPMVPTKSATSQVSPTTSLRLSPAAGVSITPPPVVALPASPAGPAPAASDAGRSSPLQGATLSRNDTALLLDVIAAAEGISTSSDRVAVLERVASVPDLAPSVVTALGKAAGRVASSTSRAKLLRTIVRKQPHAIGESRRALLDALSNEVNSTDFSAVLEDFIKRDSISEPALADAFSAAAKITSNTEKTRVLVLAARLRKPEGAARAAYLKAAATITSGTDRARALSALFEDPPGAREGATAPQY
jgi:hypothetical protein